MNRCEYCRAPTQLVLCFHCAGIIRRELLALGWIYEQVLVTLTRQAQTGDPYRDGGKSSETPLMFDEGASEAAWTIRNTVCAWAVDVGIPCAGEYVGNVIAAMADRWLDLSRLEQAVQLIEELRFANEAGLRVVDRPAVRVYLGDCHCGRKVHADPRDETHVCGHCGTEHDIADLRAANREAGQQIMVTAREAELYLGEVYGKQVTAKRIWQWAERGKIKRYEGGVFKVADILARLQSVGVPH